MARGKGAASAHSPETPSQPQLRRGPLASAQGVDHLVAGDADEPTAERTAVGVEAICRGPGGHEHVLGQLVGQVVAGRPSGERVHGAPVALVRRVERAVLARPEGELELGIGDGPTALVVVTVGDVGDCAHAATLLLLVLSSV